MDGMDLKTGRVTSRTYSADDFIITITNPAFTYQDGVVTVNPGDQPRQDGEMIITWKGQPLAFSSAPIKRTISLHWDNLKDGYYIAFNSTAAAPDGHQGLRGGGGRLQIPPGWAMCSEDGIRMISCRQRTPFLLPCPTRMCRSTPMDARHGYEVHRGALQAGD